MTAERAWYADQPQAEQDVIDYARDHVTDLARFDVLHARFRFNRRDSTSLIAELADVCEWIDDADYAPAAEWLSRRAGATSHGDVTDVEIAVADLRADAVRMAQLLATDALVQERAA